MKEVIYIRIEKEIKQKLDMLALKENRSLNNYLVTLLTKIAEKEEKDERNKWTIIKRAI